MNDHITKPIDPERLLSALSTWVPLPQREAGIRQNGQPDLPADLAALAAVDAGQGIRRIGGNTDAYRKQLQRFAAHYQAITEIRGLVDAGELKAAEERCHALKGVSGNLAAVALFEAAAEVDSLLKQNRCPDPGQLQRMDTLLAELLAEIGNLPAAGHSAAAEASVTAKPQAEMTALLEKLADALEHDLGAAEDLMEQVRASLADSHYQAIVAEISNKLDRFAIDEAQSQLTELRRLIAQS